MRNGYHQIKVIISFLILFEIELLVVVLEFVFFIVIIRLDDYLHLFYRDLRADWSLPHL